MMVEVTQVPGYLMRVSDTDALVQIEQIARVVFRSDLGTVAVEAPVDILDDLKRIPGVTDVRPERTGRLETAAGRVNHREAWAAQIADVKAHLGELRSVDGKSVERLLADRAAEPTPSTLELAQAEALKGLLHARTRAEVRYYGDMLLAPRTYSFDEVLAHCGLTEADLADDTAVGSR